jgi:hypothetical protein
VAKFTSDQISAQAELLCPPATLLYPLQLQPYQEWLVEVTDLDLHVRRIICITQHRHCQHLTFLHVSTDVPLCHPSPEIVLSPGVVYCRVCSSLSCGAWAKTTWTKSRGRRNKGGPQVLIPVPWGRGGRLVTITSPSQESRSPWATTCEIHSR